MKLRVLGYDTAILGYSRTLSLYKDWKTAEAKLVKRGKSWYLFVTFRKKEEEKEKEKAKKEGLTTEDANKNKEKKRKKEEFKPTGLVAVDINQDFLTVGNDKTVVEIPTRLDDAHHYVDEAEKLQRKYPTK